MIAHTRQVQRYLRLQLRYPIKTVATYLSQNATYQKISKKIAKETPKTHVLQTVFIQKTILSKICNLILTDWPKKGKNYKKV